MSISFDGITDRRLTSDYILSKTSELELFKFYCKPFKRINEHFISELRISDSSTCCIQSYQNRLFYKDFKTGDSYNIFRYIMTKYMCSYKECLEIVYKDFNLSNLVDDPSKVYIPFVASSSTGTDEIKKRNVIKVKYREWNSNDESYWNSFSITLNILKKYQVYPISHFWINDYMFKGDKLSYGYYDSGLWKIYQPENIKGNKWFSNFHKDIYSGFNQLPWLGELLIITSSHKDVMTLASLEYNAISPQSESQNILVPFVNKLYKRFKRIIVNYDNDSAGRKSSSKLCEKYNFDEIFIDKQKDISDYVKAYGKEEGVKLMKTLTNG